MELFDLHAWTKAGDFLLGVVVPRGFVLGALVLSVGLVMRRVSAAMRAAFWTAGAGALLLLPLVAGFLPAWELGLARFPEQLLTAPEAGAAAGGAGVPIIVWLALVWLAGSLLLLLRFLVHLVRIATATRRARPVREGLAELADDVASQLNLAGVRVALSDTGVPLTWGLWRPVVLLPGAAADWPVGLQRAVLQHEMAHIRRRDYACLVALELCRALHWPNPFVWYMLRRARMDQELACDDAAIRSGIAPPEYARHLVAVARSFAVGPRVPAGALPVVGVSPLMTRVEAALESGANREPLTPSAAAAALALILVTAGPVAAANLWSCPDGSVDPAARSGGAETTSTAGPIRSLRAVPAPSRAQAAALGLELPSPAIPPSAMDCPNS